MLYSTIAAVTLSMVALAQATDYPPAPPTFQAKDYTTWAKLRHEKSKRADINVRYTNTAGEADYVDLFRVDLVGDAYNRGYGHGYLLRKEIIEFTGPKLNQFYRDEVMNIDISALPDGLEKIFKVIQVKGAIAAPDAFKAGMQWVWETEKQFVPYTYIEEMTGMAYGICDAAKLDNEDCDVEEWQNKIQQLNMLPELIRMACTAYGAWGNATPEGSGLVQLRALDFGGGPWVNFTVVQTHRNPADNDFNSFVSISFPGMVGVITGVSERGIGVSEKVWMTYDTRSMQPGSYDGEADVLILRDILQFSKNRVDAEEYLKQANRTWGIWVGIGDYETQVLDLVAYRQEDAVVYTDKTIGEMTGMPYIESVCYVDKHPQPSHDGVNGSLPTALSDFWGQISLETTKTIVQAHQTGDVHIASYDFTAKQMYVAIGKVDKAGEYGENGEGKAYNRPYLAFDLNDLWNGL